MLFPRCRRWLFLQHFSILLLRIFSIIDSIFFTIIILLFHLLLLLLLLPFLLCFLIFSFFVIRKEAKFRWTLNEILSSDIWMKSYLATNIQQLNLTRDVRSHSTISSYSFSLKLFLWLISILFSLHFSYHTTHK